MLKKLLKQLCLPWWTAYLPRRRGSHPYFGPPTKTYGGPDLKIRKLKALFGNSLWPSCVYVFSGKPLPLGFVRKIKQRGIPVLLDQNGVHYPAWDPHDYERNNARLKELHALADQVIYQSRFCERSTQEWVKPPAKPSLLLYNAVDTDHFVPAVPKPVTPFILLAATYFNASKRYVLDSLIQVLARLHALQPGNYRLILAGKMHAAGGSRLPAWAQQVIDAANLSAWVDYAGPYHQREAPQFYQRAHALLHLTPLDACPSSVLEAMACGLPVVCAASGGTPELIGDQGGISVAAETSYQTLQPLPPEPVADAVRTIERDWLNFSHAARQRALQFSLTNWFHRHQELQAGLTK